MAGNVIYPLLLHLRGANKSVIRVFTIKTRAAQVIKGRTDIWSPRIWKQCSLEREEMDLTIEDGLAGWEWTNKPRRPFRSSAWEMGCGERHTHTCTRGLAENEKVIISTALAAKREIFSNMFFNDFFFFSYVLWSHLGWWCGELLAPAGGVELLQVTSGESSARLGGWRADSCQGYSSQSSFRLISCLARVSAVLI